MNIKGSFREKFPFNPNRAFGVGLEREYFLVDANGNPVAAAKAVLDSLPAVIDGVGSFGYELSACQVETQSFPQDTVEGIWASQVRLEDTLTKAARQHGVRAVHMEVAPEDMPLDVYPDPNGRYQRIAVSMPEEVLRAACRVMGTHVHIGLPDHETALRVYNGVVDHVDELSELGDGSSGERLSLYRVVKPDNRPPRYASWEAFEAFASEQNFFENPRDCWHLVRLTIHGTIECRMFGATDSLDNVIKWGAYCRRLCLRYA